MADEKETGRDDKVVVTTPPEVERQSSQEQIDGALETAERDRVARMEPASIGAAAAPKLEASGAFIEEGAKKMVDVDHPAVDNNPRAGTTVQQNQIDFNDPTLTDSEAVEQQLADQG